MMGFNHVTPEGIGIYGCGCRSDYNRLQRYIRDRGRYKWWKWFRLYTCFECGARFRSEEDQYRHEIQAGHEARQ